MSGFLIVLFCCLVGAQSKCLQAPVGKLPEGCKIGNLTVTVQPSYEMISSSRCNITMVDTFFNNQPQSVAFQYISAGYAPAYLLTVVDVTSKNLIWMVSNLTIGYGLKIIPFNNGRFTQEIVPWHKPYTNFPPQHVIEFLVFEEHRSYPTRTYDRNPSLIGSPFNLSTWINSQRNSGITICGPVGGGSAVATATQSPSGPTQAPSNNRKRNNSNRNKFNAVSLAGLVLIVAIFESF